VATAVISAGRALAPLVARSPKLQAILEYQAKIAPMLAQVERARTANERRAAAKRLREGIEQALLNRLGQLQNPAEYAKGFLEGKLREWISKPLPVDGDESLVFRVLAPKSDVPLFSSQARLGVEIEYLPQDLTVQATGLYFRYEPGQALPRAVIDNLKMEVDYKATTLAKIRSLGEELTEDLDLPIKIILKDKPDFSRGVGNRRGGIRFDVVIGVMQGETVKVEAQDLILYPGNRVDWKDGTLKLEIPLEPPIPIGTTPFGFWSMSGSFGPRDKSLGFGTRISTLVSPPAVVNFNVEAKTQIPVQSIAIAGKFEVATLPLLTAEGKIDFTKGIISGSFKGNETPLKQLAFAEGKFELKRERFIADGKMQFFGQSISDMHCEINLVDGSATLTDNGGFELFGVSASSTLQVNVAAGFERISGFAEVSVEVDGIQPYGKLPVSVSIAMDSAQSEPVEVRIHTFMPELDLPPIRVGSLTECNPENLRKWIGNSGALAYHRLLKALAQADEDTRRLAAKLDKQTRDFVNRHFGVTWQTGVPELDALGGQLSEQFKDIGGSVSEGFKEAGGQVAEGFKKIWGG
jgi:hypothetical protein